MAIFWAKDLYSGKEKVKLEIMLGESVIGDKMYYRVNGSNPNWFSMNDTSVNDINRNSIIKKALELIHQKFGDVKLYDENNKEFSWNEM